MHSFLHERDNAASARLRLAKNAAATSNCSIVPAGGTNAADYSEREMRHILAL
jgi:hypothetical protein